MLCTVLVKYCYTVDVSVNTPIHLNISGVFVYSYTKIDYNFSYELQIEKEYQRKGLGRFMINAMERIAKFYEMEKLILTVLSNNTNAIDFFKSMGFIADDTSPSKSEATGYEIFSKKCN